jgi:glycosyltransferase involved in cell wall biosynthesis
MLTLVGDDPATTRYYDGIARTLDPERYRLVFGTIRNPGTVQERVANYGHRVFCLDCRSRLGFPRAVSRLARLIREEQIDVIHGNEELGGFLCGLAGVLAGRGVRIYHRQHERTLSYDPATGPQGNPFQRLKARLSTLNYRAVDTTAGLLANRVLTLAERHCRDVLHEHPGWARKVAVAHHGVWTPEDLGPAITRGAEIRRDLGPDAGPVLAIVGRLNWRKGHTVLFDALQLLKTRERREPTLLVVGYGPIEDVLKSEVAARGLEKVRFVGKQSDVLPWFCACDVAVVPSLTEPFGLVAAEAMACARPLVASAVGGLTEIVVDGETGRLVPPGEPGPLADSIGRLIADPVTAAAMGRAGRDRYEREFTQEAMTRRWERQYDALLAERDHPRTPAAVAPR